MIVVSEQTFLIVTGSTLLILGLILTLTYRRFLDKWFKTFGLDQPDANPMSARMITLRQKWGTVLVLIGGLYLLIRGLGVF